MYLKRLDIKNFRVFDEEGVSLIFNQGVNAIIGENNSGKSSVIDAIRIAYSTVTYKKDIFFSKSDFHVNEDGTTADYAQFDVFLEDVPKRLFGIRRAKVERGEIFISNSKNILLLVEWKRYDLFIGDLERKGIL